MNGWSREVIHGLPPCMRVTFNSTVFGVIFCTYASNSSAILFGSWLGTSLMVSLSMAVAGSTLESKSGGLHERVVKGGHPRLAAMHARHLQLDGLRRDLLHVRLEQLRDSVR